jgi:RluA family pseudouridine synthase
LLNYRPVRIIEPYPFAHQFRVKQADIGKTLLDHFVEKFPFKTKQEWLEKIELGLLTINSSKSEIEQKLRFNDLITHFNPSIIEPSVPDEIEIIQNENDWLAVFKPAPMPMHSGGRYHKNSLQFILEERIGTPFFITHRLDAVTSGIIILAKSEKAAEQISRAFRNNEPQKKYIALVNGIPVKKDWTIDKPIRRKEGFVFECCKETYGGKSAQTSFSVIKKGDMFSEIECYPKTGRTHQIRLHLKESGLPIADDWVYLEKDSIQKTMQTRAIHLCHTQLKIPSLGIDLQCELPKWWGDLD